MKNIEYIINTPIGPLSFRVNADEIEQKSFQICSYEIEPDLSSDMDVEKCIAVILRCSSTKNIEKINFSCTMKNRKITGSRGVGVFSEICDWKDRNTLVMIGTEDKEWLSSRLNWNQSMFISNPITINEITINENTINICIKNFPNNDELSLHYVIAWNTLPEKVPPSCWFAVDILHEKISNRVKSDYPHLIYFSKNNIN